MNFTQLWELKKTEWEKQFPGDYSADYVDKIFQLADLFTARYEKEKGRILGSDEYSSMLYMAADLFNSKK